MLEFGRLNPFIPNTFSHPYRLDKSISNLRVVGWYFSFLFKFSVSKSREDDQMPHFAASDLVLHCLPMSYKKDASLHINMGQICNANENLEMNKSLKI